MFLGFVAFRLRCEPKLARGCCTVLRSWTLSLHFASQIPFTSFYLAVLAESGVLEDVYVYKKICL